MPLIFRTEKDAPAVEIAGAGVAGPGGKGGVHVEAAAAVMAELQDEAGEPLAGAKLKRAAEDFAEARGLKVATGSDEVIAGLPAEVGRPVEGVSARDASIEAGKQYEGLVPVNASPEDPDQIEGNVGAGTTIAAGEPQEG